MNPSDLRVLESLSNHNPELARLLEKHRHYEKRLEEMDRYKWLSPTEQQERQRIKRMKLAGRDRMAALLVQHRGDAHPD